MGGNGKLASYLMTSDFYQAGHIGKLALYVVILDLCQAGHIGKSASYLMTSDFCQASDTGKNASYVMTSDFRQTGSTGLFIPACVKSQLKIVPPQRHTIPSPASRTPKSCWRLDRSKSRTGLRPEYRN